MASRTELGPRSAIFHHQTPAGERGDGGGHRAGGQHLFAGYAGADGSILRPRKRGRSGLRRQMQSGH